jgi:hypothetical protein
MPELAQKNLALAMPTGIGTLGVSFSHIGYELFSQMKVGLAYAREFGPRFQAGLQLKYLLIDFGDHYGSASSLSFEIGAITKVGKQISIGAWVANPFGIHFSSTEIEIPVIIRLGFLWEFNEAFLGSLEAEKNSLYSPTIIRCGFEYNLKKRFFFRIGFTSQQEIFTMGFGLKIKFINLDLSATMHQVLGFTPQSGLTFQF